MDHIPKFIEFFHLRFFIASYTSWELYKEVETKILWVNICAQDLEKSSYLDQ